MKHLLSLALMGAGACALCVMPSFQKHPLQRKFFHRCFAHRGLFDNQTRCENSLSAFEAAAQAGYGIELDLQMTADGKIVVFHDDDLQRMCSSPLWSSSRQPMRSYRNIIWVKPLRRFRCFPRYWHRSMEGSR